MFSTLFDNRVPKQEFAALKDEILELFPDQCANEIYILPVLAGENNGEGIAAQGYLVNTYKFFVNILRVAGILDKISKKKINSQFDQPASLTIQGKLFVKY